MYTNMYLICIIFDDIFLIFIIYLIIYVSNNFSLSIFCLWLNVYFFILILFLLSVCRCCPCELEAYDTKINSLYASILSNKRSFWFWF